MRKFKIGILGATGNVGAQLLNLLESWDENKINLDGPPRLFGTKKSAGREIDFKNHEIIVQDSLPENFEGLDIILSTATSDVSEKLVPEALKRGVKLVIDTDSFYRMNESVPLITAGVNDHDIDWHKGIIAGPNCTTAQLILPLHALNKAFGLKRVVVSTYQAISGAGKGPMDLMIQDCQEVLKNPEYIKRIRDTQVAFNVIPMISSLLEDGYSKEERKVCIESRKMLNYPDLQLTCTAVRVPVMTGHSESVNIELKKSFNLNEVNEVLKNQEYIQLWEDWSKYPMPLDVAYTEPVHVGRVRIDQSQPNTLDMWVVADNLWIGAALNALRIAEKAIERGKV